MASAGAILKAIRESELTDEELSVIAETVFKKRQAGNLRRSRGIQIGDVVQLARIKPKYLQGETGVLVERILGGKMRIKLDHPQGRFTDTVVVHPQCVEPLDA